MANTTAAIMALPAPLESIRLVGDEDKHATLLYFGETSSLPADAKGNLVDAVKLASAMLFPFSESIRDITRLGDENPPALVALLSDRCMTQVRNLFMMNPAVNSYLSNTPQFPSFTPHVTLGHPDFAEEVILRSLMNQLYRVSFDRLAVWWNDARIEIPLAQMDNGGDMAMSEAIENFLEHHGFIDEATEDDAQQHGVKGQKWGVRRPRDSSTGLVTGSSKLSLKRALGGKGSEDGSGVKTGLKPRVGSADQIAQDRIAKKLATGGVKSVSNADIQAYARRLQLQSDLQKVLDSQSASQRAKSDGFIKRFVKTQANRQTNRVVNAALDIAVEKALEQAGIKKSGGKLSEFDKKNKSKSEFGDTLQILSGRIKPKKK